MEHKKQHFLIVSYSAQGHINPSLHLAKCLARITASPVTFSTITSAHRKLFPVDLSAPNQQVNDDGVTHIPFSDGYDNGYNRSVDDPNIFISKLKTVGSESLSSILQNLNARGRPVTCVIYGLMLPWVADAAKEYNIPSVLYWIQSATVFALYYHYFRKHLPGLTPLQARDLPSFLTTTYKSDNPFSKVHEYFEDTFKNLEIADKPKVLVNTFDELEPDVLSAIYDIELIATGPSFPSLSKYLFKEDGKRYVEWLDAKEERSVVYVSFGSIAVVMQRQMEEILKGLKGRPYLVVVRKDTRVELEGVSEEDGMVVEWCDQTKVLSHGSVGCFVTHCGWNSTVESVVCGVPIVGVPQWTDQGTNAVLAEKAWGNGVRGEVNEEGFLEGVELKKCIDLVMGTERRGVEIRERARVLRENARKAMKEEGSSNQNLRAFVMDYY